MTSGLRSASAATEIAEELSRNAEAIADIAARDVRTGLETLAMRATLAGSPPGIGGGTLRSLDQDTPRDWVLDRIEAALTLMADARPDDFRVWYWWGLAALERGDEPCALALFRRAAGCYAGSALSWSLAADILERSGRQEEALAFARAACLAAPEMLIRARKQARLVRRDDPLAASIWFARLLNNPPPRQLDGGPLTVALTDMAAERRRLADASPESDPPPFHRPASGEAPRPLGGPEADRRWAAVAEHRLSRFLAEARHRHGEPAPTEPHPVHQLRRRYKGYAVYRVDGVYFAVSTRAAVLSPEGKAEVRAKRRRGVIDDVDGWPALQETSFLAVMRAIDRAVDAAASGA